MKKTPTFFFTFFLFSMINFVYAQNNTASTWMFSAGVNTVDIRVPSNLTDVVKDYLNGSIEDLNYYGAPFRLTAEKSFDKGLSIQVAGSLNKLERGFHKENTPEEDSKFFLLDTKLKYALANLFNKEQGWFGPFVGLGAGYSFMDIGDDLKLGAGGGFNINISDHFGLSFESYYHHNFSLTGTDFFQHSFGLTYRPSEKLSPINNAIDTDKDGVVDKYDKCPNVYGFPEFDGCKAPDTDVDGIIDSKDQCPDIAGPKANNGCPWKDTDGDGVLDKDDDCPNKYGETNNKGCPKKVNIIQKPKNITEIKTPIKEEIAFPEIAVYFDVDSYKIINKDPTKLNNSIAAMKKSGKNIVIRAHTDSGGSNAYNLILSEKRANAVKYFLIRRGIDSKRISLIGLGEVSPDFENTTSSGRAHNRRATISIVK